MQLHASRIRPIQRLLEQVLAHPFPAVLPIARQAHRRGPGPTAGIRAQRKTTSGPESDHDGPEVIYPERVSLAGSGDDADVGVLGAQLDRLHQR